MIYFCKNTTYFITIQQYGYIFFLFIYKILTFR